MAMKPLGGPAGTDPPRIYPNPNADSFLERRKSAMAEQRPPGVDPPGSALPGGPKTKPKLGPVVRPPPPGWSPPGGPKTEPKPGPVVRPPPSSGIVKPVGYRPPPGTLPVEPIGSGSLSGASGSGGNYVSNASPNVSRRRGMTKYSNPVHPSSSRRRGS